MTGVLDNLLKLIHIQINRSVDWQLVFDIPKRLVVKRKGRHQYKAAGSNWTCVDDGKGVDVFTTTFRGIETDEGHGS